MTHLLITVSEKKVDYKHLKMERLYIKKKSKFLGKKNLELITVNTHCYLVASK